jgi:hypothetical protein
MMQFPSFTAANALPNHSAYRNRSGLHAEWGQVLVPALPPEGGGNNGFKGFGGCVQDCLDQYPQLNRALCERSCRDSGVSPGGSSTDEQINNALSRAGCWAWYLACTVNPFSFGCAAVRDDCLRQIR